MTDVTPSDTPIALPWRFRCLPEGLVPLTGDIPRMVALALLG